MPRPDGRKLFRVRLRRKSAASKTIHTQARSRRQARRFAQVRNPGFTATRVTEA